MKKVVLVIEGMSCSGCSNGLEKYLNKQDGIEEATVNLVMATASIKYKDNLTIDDLNRFVSEAGFKSLGEDIKKEEKKETIQPFIIFGILALLLMYISMGHMIHLPILDIFNMTKHPIIYSITLLLLTIPFLIYGWKIIHSGVKNLIHLMPNMDTLVTIGIVSSFLYSLFNVIMVIIGKKSCVENLYFESTAFVIYFIMLGKYIDKQSKNKTKEAIKGLVTMTPERARIKTNDGYNNITIDEVKKGDILICLPGDKVAVDGEIIKGSSTFDESFITGESLPVLKKVNDKVIAGSINYDSEIEYKAEKIGKESTISEVVKLVVEATNTKSNIEKVADKISLYFVPTIIVIGVLTFIINLVLNKDISTAINNFVTVLVVACPCALGLATPLALVVSVGQSAKKGILVKDSETLEIGNKIDTVVFDKTGTITNGTLSVSSINNHSDLSNDYILELLGSIEKHSTHPLALGINKYINEEKIKTNKDLSVEDLLGYGVKAKDEKDNIYYACNSKLLKKLDINNSYEDEEKKLAKDGNSVIYLVKNNKVVALFGLKDVIRKETTKVIKKLKDKGLKVILLSGDNKITTEKIAESLDFDEVISEVTPKEKNNYIKKLVSEGHKVMMIGDGINDAPALTSATIGVTLKGATDIANNSSNVVIVNNNLEKIIEFINISKRTLYNVKENLFWASIYNVLMIPIATGLFKIQINPMIACIAMILSSLTVTFNALRLKKNK